MLAVYDSGVGGLTALAALRAAAPQADVLYLGDTARVPYGTHSASTVCRYAREVLAYLSAFSPEAVLVACGTVSSVFLPTAGAYPFPLYGIVEAGARAAAALAPTGRIAVLATEATVRSGVFAARLAALAPRARVTSLACPLFVALAECGIIGRDDELPHRAAARLLAPLSAFSPEVILLGCTHFPWLIPHIAPLFPRATLVDCGAAAARLLAGTPLQKGNGRVEYHVTDGRASFLRAVHRITGASVSDTVREVTLT